MKRQKLSLIILLIILAVLACNNPAEDNGTSTQTKEVIPSASATQAEETSTATVSPPPAEDTPTADPYADFPPVVGPDPSPRTAVFYYPWYGSPEFNQSYVHWGDGANAPSMISADYYPVLGAYSAYDPLVVAQHFAWLRETGVGVIVSSWWGRGNYEDLAVPILLEQAERYGIKVAFHIEPYGGRSANSLVRDIKYLYLMYGDHPAFYRTTETSRWSADDRAKGLFFVWSITMDHNDGNVVEAEYWQEALDEIHALPDGGIVLADRPSGDWVDRGHFDGLYNYATLETDPSESFDWAVSIPQGAWYVPSVIPGFSAIRISYNSSTYTPRNDGETYNAQWEAALGTGVEPAMVSITSFNEWHEGTQIEPALPVGEIPYSYVYSDYAPFAPEGYLELTASWVETFLTAVWPETYRIRLRITTTSDWTTFGLAEGGNWLQPSVVSLSEDVSFGGFDGSDIALLQSIDQAKAGNQVEYILDLALSEMTPGETLIFNIERGDIGVTVVEFYNYLGDKPVLVETVTWGGTTGGRNSRPVEIAADLLINPVP